ncbi:MAG: FAD:protein FMN transferase [Bacteroidetes bacterium]|nr:FAD:protein FMN transferase [Bacteroidota bacterium]
MWRSLILIIVIVSSCVGSSSSDPPIKLMGEAQGTYYSIIYFDKQQRDFQFEIDSLLDAFDQSVSLWIPNSILSRVNNNEDNVLIDKFFSDNFFLSKKVASETDGAFDFTIGPLVKAWGFGYDNHRQIDSLIIDSLLKIVGYQKVDLFKNMVIKKNKNTTFDFNAIAQGYSVDMVGQFLLDKQINNFLVDIGGEVMARGRKPDNSPWKVGIEKPAKNATDQRSLSGVIKLINQSVATSGNYRKFFEEDGKRYAHTIDPHTGYPVQHNLLSVSIICNNTALADAYATACMVMGLEKSIKFVESRDDLEAFFIYSNHQNGYDDYATEGFKSLIVKDFN